MKKSGSVFFIAFCFFCLLLSAVNLNEPISEKTNLFDLAQLEKKLEEVLGFKFSFAPKQAEETKKTVENQEFTESSPANEPSSDLNQSSPQPSELQAKISENMASDRVILAPNAPITEPSKNTAFAKDSIQPKEITKSTVESKEPQAESLKEVTQPKIVLKSIQFTGNKSFSSSELNPSVAQFIGQEMSYEDLLTVGVSVERFYNKQNRLARVILAPQDLTDGVLQLNVIESVISKIKVEQALDSMPKTQDYILAAIQARQKQGDALDSKAIDRGLAVANEVPGVSVTGTLEQGEMDGETELILKMYKNRGRQAELVVDNYGSRSTGSYRAMLSASFFNPQAIADLFNLTAIHTKGSEYARLAYSIPIGVDGWRMGANLSAMTYEVVVGAVGMVGAAGKAITQGLDWAYPLIRSTEENITLLFNVDNKKYQNTSAQGIELSNYKVDTASAQINGTSRNIDTGTNINYSAQLTVGKVNLDGSLSQVTDMTGARTEGIFEKVRLNATINQAITDDTSILGSLTIQRASRNLDSSEKMQLGGATGIRAYPTGEGSGSEGEILSLELRKALTETVNISGFYELGQIHQQHNPNFPGGPTNNSYILRGTGLSATYVDPSGVQLKATLSRRLGNNPNPTQTGTDQDGTFDRNRFWLQLSIPFY